MQVSSSFALWSLILALPICLYAFYVDMKFKRISNMTVWALFAVFVASAIRAGSNSALRSLDMPCSDSAVASTFSPAMAKTRNRDVPQSTAIHSACTLITYPETTTPPSTAIH